MKKLLEQTVSNLAYPVLITWPIVASMLALHSGRMPQMGIYKVIGEGALSIACFIPVVLTLAFLEKRMPARAERASKQDVKTDAINLAMAWFALTPIAQQVLRVLAFVSAGWMTGLLGHSPWPSHWPILAQLALALAVGEFGQYWFHRLAHETQIGWRVHATHHGTPQVYWLNSTRFHAIEVIVKNVFQVGPLIILGCSRETFLVYGIFTAVHGWVQHSNVAYRTGPFDYIFGTPGNHRWHHSTIVAEANHNYGVVLALWDHVFGTFYSPIGVKFSGQIGIGDMPDFPKTYLGQLVSPFVWNQLPRVQVGDLPAAAPQSNEPAIAPRAM